MREGKDRTRARPSQFVTSRASPLASSQDMRLMHSRPASTPISAAFSPFAFACSLSLSIMTALSAPPDATDSACPPTPTSLVTCLSSPNRLSKFLCPLSVPGGLCGGRAG